MTLKSKVEAILQSVPHTRNDDVELMLNVWTTFYPKAILNGVAVSLDDIRGLPREDHIKRIRAHFQNTKKLYLPTDPAVAKQRKFNIEEWRSLLGYR